MSASMYSDFASGISAVKTSTPPTRAIPGREAEMAANNNGGVSFLLDDWGVLDRFLMLGSESAGYTVSQQDVTKQGFDTVKCCISRDGKRVIDRLAEYSLGGRAPKNDPAVVALALAAVYGDAEVQSYAYENLNKVCRIGTHLFLFVSILDSLGKWNAAAKRGVAKWYTNKEDSKLAVQLLKYQQRNGWAHRDVLRLAHVKPLSESQSSLFRYSVKGELEQGTMVPQVLVDFEMLKRSTDRKEVIRLIEGSDLVTWEMVPTQFLKDKDVLFALLKNMGMTAVIRKLGPLTANGVIAPLSEGSKLVISKLSDVEAIKRGRVHPITTLQAMKQYSQGRGEKGSLVWSPDQRVVDALDGAFYAGFEAVEKNNKNYMVGVDISGSMFGANVNGSPNLTAAEVAGVMAMAVVRNQPNYYIVGFKEELVELKISPKMRLDAALKVMRDANWRGGSTDPSKTFEHALKNKLDVDVFTSITDNDVNSGSQHPAQALNKYRKGMNKAAASVVIATSMSGFTIADPRDNRSLDIAGFDSAAPQIIASLVA